MCIGVFEAVLKTYQDENTTETDREVVTREYEKELGETYLCRLAM